MSISDLRQHYDRDVLKETGLATNPMDQFKQWFEQALNEGVLEPNAMVVSTVNAQGQPSSRTLLCKGFDETGFKFYTNYDSNKGKDLLRNPNISAIFVWLPLQRQVHINGYVQKLSIEESTAYFKSRPIESQIGAWASLQSQPITREELEKREVMFAKKFGQDVPKPEHWGGYVIIPQTIEFWQGRPSRLHDRILYTKTDKGEWTYQRLSP